MLALPTLAWADPSPSNNGSGNATAPNGVTANVQADGTITNVAVSDTPAQGATGNIVASFLVEGDATNVTLTFNVGKQYAGHAYTVYIEHNTGATETQSGTVQSDGTIIVKVDSLSIFSIAIGDKVADTAAANTGAKSPQTGVDLGTVAGATVVTAIAAGAVFVALRKKVTE